MVATPPMRNPGQSPRSASDRRWRSSLRRSNSGRVLARRLQILRIDSVFAPCFAGGNGPQDRTLDLAQRRIVRAQFFVSLQALNRRTQSLHQDRHRRIVIALHLGTRKMNLRPVAGIVLSETWKAQIPISRMRTPGVQAAPASHPARPQVHPDSPPRHGAKRGSRPGARCQCNLLFILELWKDRRVCAASSAQVTTPHFPAMPLRNLLRIRLGPMNTMRDDVKAQRRGFRFLNIRLSLHQSRPISYGIQSAQDERPPQPAPGARSRKTQPCHLLRPRRQS